MSLFDEVLDEFLENNPLPKSKPALKIWARELQNTYKKRLGQRGRSKIKTPYRPSSEQAKAMANKRWGKTDRKNKKDS